MTELEHKVTKIVAQYKAVFPQEYIAVMQIAKQERLMQRTKFDEMPKKSLVKGGGAPFVERALVKWPETLYNLIHMKLTQKEKDYFFQDKDKRGLRWFARTYPEFKVADHI